ncbi:MAG: Transposase [Gammaproteobacteria bacterium]|jgi:hypothetical protein|nr:Transposase [Gammaproteobacteria bacterium]
MMAHQRNTKGLAIAARDRRQSTIKRVNEAINVLRVEKKIINFNSVAKAANVGKTWLYKEADIKERILKYRENNQEQKITSKSNPLTSASKESLWRMVQERVRQVETENRELKKQVEVLYGQLMKKED